MEGNLDRLQDFVSRIWGQVASPLYRNAFYIMASSVVGSGLGFFFWLVVARAYPNPNDVGFAVTLFQTISFLAALAHLGLGVALVRYLPESHDQLRLVRTSLTVVGILGLLLSLVFVVGINVWAPNLSFILDSPIYPAVILVTGLLVAVAPILDQTGVAMRRSDVLFWRTLVFSVLKIPLAIVFALYAVTSGVATGGRLGVFMALAISFGVGVVLEGIWLIPRVLPGFRPVPRLGFSRLRPMIRFSMGNYAATSIGAAGSLLLPLLILNFTGSAGAEQAAYFYVASIVAGLLYIIPGATFTSFYAEASQRNARRHLDERRAIALTLALLVPGIAVLWFFSRTMLEWFGEVRYANGAVGSLRILVFASIPVFLNTILATRVRIRKRTLPLIVGALISTAVTLGLGVVLLQANGIDGLSLAYVIGNAAPTPFYYLVARKSFAEEDVEPLKPAPTQL